MNQANEICAPAAGVVLLIDDALHMGYLVTEALRRIEQNHGCATSHISVQHVLPDAEREMDDSLAAIDSMEDFLAHCSRPVLACFVDCHLYSSPVQRSIDIQHSAACGAPPFGARFREVPLALITAGADIADVQRCVSCPVFPKCVYVENRSDLSQELIRWLAAALRVL